MKNLKLFNLESDYLTYRNSSEYLKPNVSLSDDNGNVYYNFTPPPIVYEAVDLGLSSGTKWAAQNVGARKPSDAGLYFQWGDTVGYAAEQIGTGDGKKKFSWSDYKWSIDGSSSNFSKYNTAGATLELADDAVNANMGGTWHMPTPDQIRELISNTDTGWTTSNGTGMTFTSKSVPSKSIFIPAAGYAWNGSFVDSGSVGSVWSSVLSSSNVYGGQSLSFYSDDAYLYDDCLRGSGFSVRGVLG